MKTTTKLTLNVGHDGWARKKFVHFFCSTMAFPLLGNSDHVVVSVSIDFPFNSQQDAPIHRIVYDYSHC